MDTFCPTGPAIVTPDEIPGPHGLAICCRFNRRLIQDGHTGDMIIATFDLVAYISCYMTLERVDIIATGSPAGVGHFRSPPVYLEPGDDEITVEIDELGVLSNRVLDASAGDVETAKDISQCSARKSSILTISARQRGGDQVFPARRSASDRLG